MSDRTEVELTGKFKVEKAIVKAALKEAMKEWLSEQASILGKWTFKTFMAALFVGLIYLMLTLNGWHAPQGAK